MKFLNKAFICTSTLSVTLTLTVSFLVSVLVLVALASTTLQVFATNPSITLEPDPSGEASEASLAFTTQAEHFYFIQGSESLESEDWDYLPHATYGDGSLFQADIPIDPDQSRFFYRIESATDPDSGTPALDFDNDGLSNADELIRNDSPFVSGYTIDTDQDGLSNFQEQLRGTRTQSADSDGDGVIDSEDAIGYDPFFTFSAVPESFIVHSLGGLNENRYHLGTNKESVIAAINDLGTCVLKTAEAADNFQIQGFDVVSNGSVVSYHEGYKQFHLRHLNNVGELLYDERLFNSNDPTIPEATLYKRDNQTLYPNSERADVLFPRLLDDLGRVWFYEGYDYQASGTSLTERSGVTQQFVIGNNPIAKTGISFIVNYADSNSGYNFPIRLASVNTITINEGYGIFGVPVPISNRTGSFEALDIHSTNGSGDYAYALAHQKITYINTSFHAQRSYVDIGPIVKYSFSEGASVDIEEDLGIDLERIARLPNQPGLWKYWVRSGSSAEEDGIDARLSLTNYKAGRNVLNTREQGSGANLYKPVEVMKIAENGLMLVDPVHFTENGNGRLYSLWANGRILTEKEILGADSPYDGLYIQALSDSGEFIAGTALKKGGSVTQEYLLIIQVADFRIVHPATGPLLNTLEDQGDGGYIATQRILEDGDIAPVTKIQLPGTHSNHRSIRLHFDSGGRYSLYQDAERSEAITSGETLTLGTEERYLYFQGHRKSLSRGGEEVIIEYYFNNGWKEVDRMRFTVVPSTFTLNNTTFIPMDWVDNPWVTKGFPNANDLFGGDDRSFDPESTRFRTRQSMDLLPIEHFDSDGLRLGSFNHNQVGLTTSYDVGTSISSTDSSRLSAEAKADWEEEDPLKVRWEVLKTEKRKMEASIERIDSHSIEILLEGDESNPLVSISPGISWDYRLTLDCSDPLNPTYSIEGTHDGFPAHEIYLDRQEINTYDPVQAGRGLGALSGVDPEKIDKQKQIITIQ